MAHRERLNDAILNELSDQARNELKLTILSQYTRVENLIEKCFGGHCEVDGGGHGNGGGHGEGDGGHGGGHGNGGGNGEGDGGHGGGHGNGEGDGGGRGHGEGDGGGPGHGEGDGGGPGHGEGDGGGPGHGEGDGGGHGHGEGGKGGEGDGEGVGGKGGKGDGDSGGKGDGGYGEEFCEDSEYMDNYLKIYGNDIMKSAKFAKAIYAFTPTQEGCISLSPGDIVILHTKDFSSEWWSGQSTTGTIIGLFPSNYVEIITEEDLETIIENAKKKNVVPKKLLSEMTLEEVKFETEKVKSQIQDLDPEMTRLGEETRELRKQRHKIWKEWKIKIEETGAESEPKSEVLDEISASYYGISQLEDFLYDLRFAMAMMDTLIAETEDDSSQIDIVLQTLNNFSTEITNQAQHSTIIRHTKKEISQFISDYKASLEEVKKSEVNGNQLNNKGSFYEVLRNFADLLEKEI